jgi:hypothetical protein
MAVGQTMGMNPSAMIRTYESFWITCVLVWIGGMDRLWLLTLGADLKF